ncbi:MAG: tetratricopeptide repeat protein, partial [Bacteroidia bacterium]|nr:tetratricopeptide repeat protein [Bacteroidia bacterium]
ANKAIVEWYGEERDAHFSDILTAAYNGEIASLPRLISMVGDTSIPDIIQASAVHILGDINIQESRQQIVKALEHENSLVRHSAVSALSNYPKGDRLSLLPSLLSDSVRIIRIQAAYVLADFETNELQEDIQQDFQKATEELMTSFSVQADYPGGQLMKGQYYQKKGQYDDAEKAYVEASRLDPYLVQPYVNLANIKYLLGDYESALSLFNKSIGIDSLNIDAYYSLGLLHAEMKNMDAAELALGKAAVLSGNPRYYYNWGLALQNIKKPKEAEEAYLKALEIEKDSETYLYALSILYLQQNQKKKALKPLQKLLELKPTNQDYQGLFNSAKNE